MTRLLKIAAREYGAYVRTVGFWLSMLLMPAVAAAVIAAPALMESRTPPAVVALVDQTGEDLAPALAARIGQTEAFGSKVPTLVALPPGTEASPAIIRQWLAGERAAPGGGKPTAVAVIHGAGEGLAVDFWSGNIADTGPRLALSAALAGVMRDRFLEQRGLGAQDLARLESLKPRVTDFSPRSASGRVSLRDRLPAIVGFAAAMLLWAMIMTGAGILLNSVIEEKSSRVLEVLLVSASVPEIMFGKILGVAGVTLTVLAVWAAVGGGVLAALQPAIAADIAAVLLGKGLIVYFAFYLVTGYLMYAAIFTAVGAFCETSREAQTLLGPVMALLSIPMVFMSQAIRRPDAPALEVLSWIPPFTPFLMPARAAGEPPLWQVAGTGLMMLATVSAVIWLATRAFRAGALSSGKVDLKGLVSRVLRAE